MRPMTDSDRTTMSLVGAQPDAANDEQPDVLLPEEAARAWRNAFEAQLTPDMMDEVTAYAARRASWIETATGIRDPQLTEELVQNALGDTFARTVVWDPTRCELAMHLKGVIRSRCSHELERANVFVHVSIETEDENVVTDAMSANAVANGNVSSEPTVQEFNARLRFLAADDPPVLRLLDLYEEGISERRDVYRLGPMSPAAYHNAFRRLMRLVDSLPFHLVTATKLAMA